MTNFKSFLENLNQDSLVEEKFKKVVFRGLVRNIVLIQSKLGVGNGGKLIVPDDFRFTYDEEGDHFYLTFKFTAVTQDGESHYVAMISPFYLPKRSFFIEDRDVQDTYIDSTLKAGTSMSYKKDKEAYGNQ